MWKIILFVVLVFFSGTVPAHSSDLSDRNLAAGRAFLEENGESEGVVTTESGLQYLVLHEGDGPRPTASDSVTVHYRGTLIDGPEFDSSYQRDEPASFPLQGVSPGWAEALQLMKVGSRYRLFIPPHLAYGERGAGLMIGPNATLIFEVELLEVESEIPPAAPTQENRE